MKKKILFMVINMNVGGTERALLNKIAELPADKYEITILMLEKYGGFLEFIPGHVHVAYLNEYEQMKEILHMPPKKLFIKNMKKGRMKTGSILFIIQILAKTTRNRGLFFQYLLRNTPRLQTEYDIAAAYAGPMDFISYFVCHKITAAKKIQWIHFDITQIGYDKTFAAQIYPLFDHIYVVSQEGKEKVIHALPDAADKIDYCANSLSPEWILQMADDGKGFTDDFTGIRILTVGRLSKEKGQDLIIPVLAKLKEAGFPVRWYCIGEGGARAGYEQLIQRYNVLQDFILLGTMPNPYPFMKQCDIYVQPSRHEGYCITLAEARCFTNPIVTTDFTGANEQLFYHQTSVIVPFDEQQMFTAVQNKVNDVLTKKIQHERKPLINET